MLFKNRFVSYVKWYDVSHIGEGGKKAGGAAQSIERATPSRGIVNLNPSLGAKLHTGRTGVSLM